jgi:hypothetical protein
MAIILALVFMWLFIGILVLIPKGMNMLESLFVFFIVSIANNLFCSFLMANIKWVEVFETPTAKSVIVIQRAIIIPVLVFIILQVHFRHKGKVTRIFSFLVMFCVLIFLERLCAHFEIVAYVHNRALIPILHSTILYGIGIFSLHIIRNRINRDVMVP